MPAHIQVEGRGALHFSMKEWRVCSEREGKLMAVILETSYHGELPPNL